MKTTKNTTWKQRLYSQSTIKSTVKSIFRSAKEDHTPHKEILSSLKLRVYNLPKYNTLPNYMQSEINGYIHANFDIMREHLEWVHWYDGKFVGTKMKYDKNFKQHLINASEHVYKNTENIY